MANIVKRTLESVEKFYRDGWNFRVKTVNGVPYLSVRKGGVEKGLGRLSPELREFIDKLKETRETPKNFGADSTQQTTQYLATLFSTPEEPSEEMTFFNRDDIESILFDLKFERAKVKAYECRYSRDGYCVYWKFRKKSQSIINFYKRFAGMEYALPVFSDTLESKKRDRVILRVNDLLCFDCDKFKPRIEKEKNI